MESDILQEKLLQSDCFELLLKERKITPYNLPPHTFSETTLARYIKEGKASVAGMHKEDITEALCFLDLEQYSYLDNIPEALCTEEMCITVLKKDGKQLHRVPKNKFSDEAYDRMCRTALDNTPEALAYIPLEKQTREICLEAVERNPTTAMHVFRDLFTKEEYEQICIYSVQQKPENIVTLRMRVDCDEFLTEEIYLAAMRAALQSPQGYRKYIYNSMPEQGFSEEFHAEIKRLDNEGLEASRNRELQEHLKSSPKLAR